MLSKARVAITVSKMTSSMNATKLDHEIDVLALARCSLEREASRWALCKPAPVIKGRTRVAMAVAMGMGNPKARIL